MYLLILYGSQTNRDYFLTQHKLIGFYNWGEVCLLRGTAWISNYNSVLPQLKGRTVIHTAILLPITPAAWVRYQVVLCKNWRGQNGTGTDFTPRSSVFPRQYHSTIAPRSSLSPYCYQKDKRAEHRIEMQSLKNKWFSTSTWLWRTDRQYCFVLTRQADFSEMHAVWDKH